MQNRREFLAKTALAGVGGGLLALAGAPAEADERGATASSALKVPVSTSKALRILILGGSGFIGPHHVQAALDRGHKVSVFNRGKSSADLPAGVEQLIGDRNGDFASIKDRDWDAVLDMATYGPVWVRTLGKALKAHVKHYTFISTVAVYETSDTKDSATDETGKVVEYREAADPYLVPEPGYQYGPLKVLCEREAEQQFPKRTLIIRPGVIAGPGDNVGGFTYIVARIDAGGEMLAPGDPLAQTQVIDVRDLAEWVIRMVEMGETGIYNAVGPALPMGWAEMLGALRGRSMTPVKLSWVPLSWLKERKETLSAQSLLFPTEYGYPGLMSMNNDKARAKGLGFRSVCTTGTDTLAWFKSQSPARQAQLIGLEESMAREHTVLVAWHAHQTRK